MFKGASVVCRVIPCKKSHLLIQKQGLEITEMMTFKVVITTI